MGACWEYKLTSLGTCPGRLRLTQLFDDVILWFTVLYLVVHPTNRKWVITLVINGISGGNVHL